MNKVFLIGNLTRDPEMRTTQSGVSLCSFTIAVNRRRGNNAEARLTRKNKKKIVGNFGKTLAFFRHFLYNS